MIGGNVINSRSHWFSVTQLTSPWTRRLSDISNYDSLCVHVLPQLKNSLKSDLCLDQGPDTDNVPILYLCHGMTPQVRTPSSPLQPTSLLHNFCLCQISHMCIVRLFLSLLLTLSYLAWGLSMKCSPRLCYSTTRRFYGLVMAAAVMIYQLTSRTPLIIHLAAKGPHPPWALCFWTSA